MANTKSHISARGDTGIMGELVRRRVAKAVELEIMRGKLQRHIDEAYTLILEFDHEHKAPSNLLVQADSLIVSAGHNHTRLLEAYEVADQDCENFRQLHMLTHNAQTPSIVLHVLTSGCVCIFETFANAAFLNQAHMVATQLSALTASFLISLSNVAMSSLGGFFIGRHKNFGEKAINPNAPEFKRVRQRANWQFKAFVVGMAGYTTTIGLVRSQETLERVTHSLPAYLELVTTPEAIMLMSVSACISVFSYYKAKTAFSDEYPDFSKRQNAIDQAQEALLDCEDEHRGKVINLFDEALDELNAQQKSQNKTHSKANKTLGECRAAYRDLEKQIAVMQTQLYAECSQLISDFKGCGGKVDKGFDLNAHCSFIGLLEGLELPERPSGSLDNKAIHDIKADQYTALERLNAAFKH